MGRLRQWRMVVLAVAATVLVVAGASAVFAAIPKLDIDVADSRVSGAWPNGTSVTFQLREPDGTLKVQRTRVAQEGRAQACFGQPIVSGDRIRVRQGTDSRTITALKLRLNVIDRVGDQVKGKATAGRSLRLRIARCSLSQGFNVDGCDSRPSMTTTVPSGGSYSFDTTGSVNLRGRDVIELILRNDTGDRFRRDGAVPVYFLELHQPHLDGAFPPGPTIEFQLFEEPGDAVPKATAALPSPDRSDIFNDGISEVPVEPGDQVVGDFAIDAKMVVPVMVTDVDPVTDTVTATCFPDRQFELVVFGVGSFTGTADAQGTIERDFSGQGDIGVTYDGRLECLAPTGDSIRHNFTN